MQGVSLAPKSGPFKQSNCFGTNKALVQVRRSSDFKLLAPLAAREVGKSFLVWF